MISALLSVLSDVSPSGAGGAGLFAGMGAMMIVFWVIGILLTVFWIWMVIDVATSSLAGNDKIVWLLVVVLLGWVGALIYYFMKRSGARGTHITG